MTNFRKKENKEDESWPIKGETTVSWINLHVFSFITDINVKIGNLWRLINNKDYKMMSEIMKDITENRNKNTLKQIKQKI